MVILPRTVGSGKKRRDVFELCATPAENDGYRIARVQQFDTLAEAATVLRYIAGGNMSEAEQIRALEIMQPKEKEKAATTDQSNRDQKDD